MLERFNLSMWLEETIISVAIVIAAVIISGIAVIILNQFKKRIADRTKTDLDDKIIDAIKRPLHLAMILVGLTIAAQRLQGKFPEINEWVFKTTDQVIVAVIIIIVTIFLLRLLKILSDWFSDHLSADKDAVMSKEFAPLINRVGKTFVVVLAALMILKHFGQDIGGLLAVLGVGSLAIALAAQDTVANTISGFIIMIDRPFRKGDRVILPSGDKADVYEIGLRSAKFLTFEHTLVIVPNQELVKSTIINLSYPREEIRVKINVGVAYGSNIEQVKSLLIAAAKEHPTVLKTPEPSSYFTNFGDSSLDFNLVCRVSKISEQWTTSEQLRCAVYDKLNEAKIEIPFPQQVVYLQQES